MFYFLHVMGRVNILLFNHEACVQFRLISPLSSFKNSYLTPHFTLDLP